ncbi:hypothetical protein MMYC01_204052 [Madurella mycetomatis]|uniref:Uncharacterized protein n=1 Tax=Madurella mycetomatis TaxID=100816 RepID=A0A175W716_9PEZI|nr:hypothetical protein MMYC01_204052 [Madurella mycetomatis]
MATFAVCRTAEIPPAVIDRFLSVAYAKSEELAPGIGPCLVVLPSGNDDDSSRDAETATMPGSAAELPPSPFIGMSTLEVAERLGTPRNRLFVVMDSRSAEDDTVLLITTASHGGTGQDEGGGVQTVRATFGSSQSVLVGLDMGTQGFGEVQSIALGSPGGVYGPERRGDGGPRKGEPAPRMVLGGH